MKSIRVLVLTIFSVLLAIGSTAHAKDPFTTIDNLRGAKKITSYYKVKSGKLKSNGSIFGEFIYLGGNEMRLVTSEWSTDVDILGLASGHFVWTDNEGRRFEISDMPENTGYAKGIIYEGKAAVGKFSVKPLSNITGDAARGRWSGVLAFPGGTFLDIALQIAGTAQEAYEECSNGSLETRVEFPGFPYQEASTLHCKQGFNGHDYSLGTFFWDDIQGAIWFVSLSGSLSPWDTFQGSVYLIPVLNAGSFAEGVFLLNRPQPFNP